MTNAARNRSARGFEVFYLSDAMDDNARAVAAAENAVWELEDEFKLKTLKCFRCYGLGFII